MGVLGIKLQCRMCGFKGSVNSRPSQESSSIRGFTFAGEDGSGLYSFRCPSCGQHSSYSLAEVRGRFYRTKRVLLFVMLGLGMAIMIFRVIHTTFLAQPPPM